MPALFYYSLKVSVCLGVIYLFYYLVLRHLTFYNWNRWFLLIGTGLSFLIPLVNVLPLLKAHNLPIINDIPTLVNFSSPVIYASNASNSYGEYLYQLIPFLFGLGVFIQGCRLVIQFASFFSLLRSATRLQHSAIKIYQVDKNVAPFSFGSAIVLNKNLLQPAEIQEIIRHELVHINQKHTIDVLWLEFLSLLNWYNPFVWLLKRAVRQNLEFIADRAVLMTSDLNKKYYQYLILKVIGLPGFAIANQFNISSLKTRIIMMNRMPSNKRELFKFVFVLPLMVALLLACRDNADTTFEELAVTETSKADLKAGLIPPPPPPPPAEPLPPPPPPVVQPASAEHKALLKRHSQVELVGWQGDNTMVIFLKSGEREEYDLNNAESRAMAVNKYGKLPQKPALPAVKNVN